MTAYRARLTEIDIRRLIKATDEDERAAAAHKLCRSMDKAELDDEAAPPPRKSCVCWPKTPPNWCAGPWP